MTKELTILAQPNCELMSKQHFLELKNAIGGSGSISAFASSFDSGSSHIGNLVKHIEESRDRAWIEGKLRNGTKVLYAKSGSASVLIVPLGEKKIGDFKGIKKAKVAEKFRIIFRTPQRSIASEFLITGGSIMGTFALGYLLSRVITLVCEGIVRSLTGAALGTLVSDALLQAGVSVRVLTWLGGEGVLAGLARFSIATLIVYGLYCIWKAGISRDYHHRLWVYNLTNLNLKITIKHLHNVEDEKSEHNKIHILPKIIAPGADEDLVGIAVSSEETQVGMGYYDFADDKTLLGGIGSLLLIEPVGVGAPFTNIVACNHVPRFGNNSMSLLFDVKGTNFKSIYEKEEGKHQHLTVKAGKGNIEAVHCMDKLKGGDKDTYQSVLAIVDKTSTTGFHLVG